MRLVQEYIVSHHTVKIFNALPSGRNVSGSRYFMCKSRTQRALQIERMTSTTAANARCLPAVLLVWTCTQTRFRAIQEAQNQSAIPLGLGRKDRTRVLGWPTWPTASGSECCVSLLESGGRDRDRTGDLLVANE